jgi:hypothetical protein
MRCLPDAGWYFLMIAAQSFPRGILSVDRDRVRISIACKSTTTDLRRVRRNKTLKKSKTHDQESMEGESSSFVGTIVASFSQCTS